ncbi:MAG TPA: hypothetical protein VFQ44_06445 [Streptosporangiaceae bacterium]|nr:hypothetical protein [Streptosporangiaceae bacterium]
MTFARGIRLGRPSGLKGPMGSTGVYLLPLLMIGMLAAAVWYLWPSPGQAQAPASLSGYRAGGARDELNCLRLVIGVDVSGSMRGFTVPRDDALTELFGWVKTNLRPDDQVAIIDFAAVAKIRMMSTTVADLGSLPPPAGAEDGYYTYFRPILADVDQLPATRCDTALVLISDAQLIDLPKTQAAGRSLLLAHHISKIRLLVPGAAIQVDPIWVKGFPSAVPYVFDGTDAEATGLALGRVVVSLTGQSLVRVS